LAQFPIVIFVRAPCPKMAQTLHRLFGQRHSRTKVQTQLNHQAELSNRNPDGSRLTTRQMRRMLDNHMFEAMLHQNGETRSPTEKTSAAFQSCTPFSSLPTCAYFNEAGGVGEIMPVSQSPTKAFSEAPKQKRQEHLLSDFADTHSGLARLIFELSGVLCSLGDSGESIVDDYSHVVHECTNFMLGVANKLQHLKTKLQLDGAIPCDQPATTGLSGQQSFTVWGQSENACLSGQVRMYHVSSDSGTDNVSEGGRPSSSSQSRKKSTAASMATSSQPRASVQVSKNRSHHVKTVGDLPDMVEIESESGDGFPSMPDLPWLKEQLHANTVGTLPSIPSEVL